MTMKILNRFIDDCVNVFQYRFMDTFQYFKERNKNKYLGDRFEEWVVKNSNISKDGCSDLDTGKIFWRLLDWRGDKYVEADESYQSMRCSVFVTLHMYFCPVAYRVE